ncbi:DUF5394 family protein [Rickettsia endosymbiont of Halotydeus destructor]|uniref:DUF5394 family protein n=1 Tax=Rickettsia endosymbiont of Halotydeus destructor TaxID=2996754 RepID=UPI003BB001EE
MAEDKKKPDEVKQFADQIKEALLGIGEYQLESAEAEKIFAELSNNEEFEQEIEKILAQLTEQSMDLTKLQTQIIILIRKYFGKLKNFNFKISEKIINKNVADVSSYLMQQRSKIVKSANQGLANPKDKLQGISKESRMNLKRLVKSFAVYQIYMFMNPKRIAGETKKMNFAYNMIKGGMNLAKKYEGGKSLDIKAYSPKFIKNLEKAHLAFSKKDGRSI